MFGRTKRFGLALLASATAASAGPVGGRVLEASAGEREFLVEITYSKDDSYAVGDRVRFQVGAGDAAIGYSGRVVKGNAVEYGGGRHLEQVFPVDGPGAKAYRDMNRRLHSETATMSRRGYVREGDYIPEFAGIDQNGDFVQIGSLKGRPFVLNFIFTRCSSPQMCPASTTRMAALQDASREAGLEELHFVTITFDPEFDSPGILRQYAEGYGIEHENYHLLTGTREWAEDLLRRFGILTIEENGTINHTMATLLVDGRGRVAYRREGSDWTVDAFLEAARNP